MIVVGSVLSSFFYSLQPLNRTGQANTMQKPSTVPMVMERCSSAQLEKNVKSQRMNLISECKISRQLSPSAINRPAEQPAHLIIFSMDKNWEQKKESKIRLNNFYVSQMNFTEWMAGFSFLIEKFSLTFDNDGWVLLEVVVDFVLLTEATNAA